jgi:hypothetical protein
VAPRKRFWNVETIGRMRQLAADGAAHSEVATALGATINSVIAAAAAHGVTIKRHTVAETADLKERERDRDKRKKVNKRLREITALHKAAGLPAVTKTSAAYRNQLPGIGERSKPELRAMLAEAARNTAEMSV